MDTVLFMLAGTPVTLGLALGAAVVLAVLVAIVISITTLRAGALRAAEAAESSAQALKANFIQQLAERDARIQDLDAKLWREQEAKSDLLAETTALRARMGEQTRQYEENLKRFENARQQMTDEFKVIAGDVLKTHGDAFSQQNREQVDVLLKPLHEKIVEFRTGLLEDRATIKEQIRALQESNLQITTEAHNLARALKGNSQTQGAWGEMILSSILERSGLRKGEQFLVQQPHTEEGGRRLRTDVEILMPNEDRIVIDSKVSLTAFDAYTNCENEDERKQHLQAHLNSMLGHIKTLGEKNYQRHARSSIDFVVMFVPIEAAFSAAITENPNLLDEGMKRGVMLTTPTTLMMVLRTVRNIWDIEKRHQNADEIAERAGTLYEKVVGFLGNMDRLGSSLDKAQQSFSEAKSQLSTGRGNVLRQVEMLRELGAKTPKQLPAGWESVSEAEPVERALSVQRSIEQTDMLDFEEAAFEESPQRLAGE